MRLSVPAFFLSAVELVNARFESSSVCRSSAGKKLLFHPGSAKSDCPKYLEKNPFLVVTLVSMRLVILNRNQEHVSRNNAINVTQSPKRRIAWCGSQTRRKKQLQLLSTMKLITTIVSRGLPPLTMLQHKKKKSRMSFYKP